MSLSSLLSLVPPSYMVVPIRDIGNKFFSTSANMNSTATMTLPTDMEMDINNIVVTDNYNEVRGHTMTHDKQASRTVSISSSEALVDYHTKMECLNDLLDNEDLREPIDRFQLLYVTSEEQMNQVSVVANLINNMREQYISIEDPALNFSCRSNENMFNVHLPYDINQALDPKSWDSNFHTISLYSSIEHLVSDIKYIKESLIRMQKYILIKSNKTNNVKDLEGVGEAVWGFISALYKSYWDQLITDKNNLSFRCKVKAQLSLQINKENSPKKGKYINKPAAISVLSLPILANSFKKVVEISKFFKKKLDNKEKKLYTQVLSTNINIATLKIKKAFPNLQNKKNRKYSKNY